MSLFRRPTDDSSSEETSCEEDGTDSYVESHHRNIQSTGVELDITSYESASLETTDPPQRSELARRNGTEEHRSVMLAAVLEELSKYKAAELLNNSNNAPARLNTHADAHYTAQSPEVQQLAQTLFDRSGQVLVMNGLVSRESLSISSGTVRQQYLSALQRLSYQKAMTERGRKSIETLDRQNPLTTALIPIPSARALARGTRERNEINPLPRYDLSFSSLPQARSHYAATFEEKGVLGRGGFGTVYRTYNLLDGREYAVKKIPLSTRSSDRYRQGGHRNITNTLREVHALSRLDHCNVVRYHATWIEEPLIITPLVPPSTAPRRELPLTQFMLIDDQPTAVSVSEGHVSTLSSEDDSLKLNHEDRDKSADFFERDIGEEAPELWSESAPAHLHHHSLHQLESIDADLGISGSSAFERSVSHGMRTHDPTVCVLHVQMSIYPMTLIDYLVPQHGVSPARPSHCFHLLPAVKILLSILCGLQYIHTRGFVHRDIKPSNIFLSTLDFASPSAFSDGYIDVGSCRACPHPSPRFINPRIGDFGLVADLASAPSDATGCDDSRSSTQKIVGTELYRPPSINRPPMIDEKLDVFAIGIILIELLLPFSTRMERTQVLKSCQTGVPPAELTVKLVRDGNSAAVIEQIVELIAGMIEPDQRRRWRCAMVKEAAERLSAGLERDEIESRQV